MRILLYPKLTYLPIEHNVNEGQMKEGRERCIGSVAPKRQKVIERTVQGSVLSTSTLARTAALLFGSRTYTGRSQAIKYSVKQGKRVCKTTAVQYYQCLL